MDEELFLHNGRFIKIIKTGLAYPPRKLAKTFKSKSYFTAIRSCTATVHLLARNWACNQLLCNRPNL